jgi:hypothetical protein
MQTFWIKVVIYLFLGLHEGRDMTQEKHHAPSLQKEHPALQNMKLYFFTIGNFVFLDPGEQI